MSLTATSCLKWPPPLTQDELIEILDQAKPPHWHEATVSANIDIFELRISNSVFHLPGEFRQDLTHEWTSSDLNSKSYHFPYQ